MKPTKPTRQELLQELESIYTSLIADGEELISGGALPGLSPTTTPPTTAPAVANTSVKQESSIPAFIQAKAGASLTAETSSKNKKSDPLTAGFNGQQSLFEPNPTAAKSLNISSVSAVEPEENPVDESKDEPLTILENPFLPRHIRERLEQERSLYEREIEAASRLQTKYRKVDTAYNKYQPLIDDVVAHFMPKIEADLRVRLQKLLAAENEK